MMRTVLPLALALMLVTGVEAQEQPERVDATAQAVDAAAQVGGPRAAERTPPLRPPPVPVQPAAPDPNETPAEAGRRAVQTRAVESMDAVQQGPMTVNWWWLVAAIVVAGLIIVAVT